MLRQMNDWQIQTGPRLKKSNPETWVWDKNGGFSGSAPQAPHSLLILNQQKCSALQNQDRDESRWCWKVAQFWQSGFSMTDPKQKKNFHTSTQHQRHSFVSSSKDVKTTKKIYSSVSFMQDNFHERQAQKAGGGGCAGLQMSGLSRW